MASSSFRENKIEACKTAEVVETLPGYDGRSLGEEELFQSLAGATIVRIGMPSMPANTPLEGGGLVIDYCVKGQSDLRRAVFAFNDCGMWLVWSG